MKIEVLMGPEAEMLLDDAEFRRKWRTLYEKCPWGSVFQGEDFVITWYKTYKSQYTPIVVTGVDSNRELSGLFTLALGAGSGTLVVAGSNQAEYQAWLATQHDGNEFIESALEKLRKKFPSQSITLLFMLPTVPVEWTEPGNRWSDNCHVRTLPRGLMEIGDGSNFKDTLRKKKQSKINRLKRLGNLRLDRIQTPAELEAIFDEVICYQALRLRGVQNLPVVEHDPLKKDFHMNLIKLPRMVHATALRVDGKLVSAQIHKYNKEQVMLDLITHSPVYARYSPGELHLLMVGMELAKEEIPYFDLTPGGNYKNRYATHHDNIHIITVFFNRSHCVRYKLKRKIAEAAKRAIRMFNVTPEQARDAYSDFRDWKQKWLYINAIDLTRTKQHWYSTGSGSDRAPCIEGVSMGRPVAAAPGTVPNTCTNVPWFDLVSEVFTRMKRVFWYKEEIRVYAYELDRTTRLSNSKRMKRDNLPDLLAYQPLEAWQSPVNKFIKRALDNLEAGQHIYTIVEDGRLAQYCWLFESPGPKSERLCGLDEQGLSLPPDSVLITEFYTFSQGRSLTRSSLHQILLDAAKAPGAKLAFIAIRADDEVMRKLIEETDFTYQFSLFEKNALGRVTNWSTAPKNLTHTQIIPAH